MAEEEERLAALFIFGKQTHKRTWFSAASFEAVGGLSLETGVHGGYSVLEERKKTTKSRKGGNGNRSSINVLELTAMVTTAYVMIQIRSDIRTKGGELVLMRGDSSSAVKWVINCGGGRGRSGRRG